MSDKPHIPLSKLRPLRQQARTYVHNWGGDLKDEFRHAVRNEISDTIIATLRADRDEAWEEVQRVHDDYTRLEAERNQLRQELAQRRDAPPCVEMTEARVAALQAALDGWDEYNATLDEVRPHVETLRQMLAEAGGQGDGE